MKESSVGLAIYSGDENLDAMSGMVNYNNWVYSHVAPYLGENVLEAGCGNGNITKFILQSSGIKRYAGVDMSAAYCEKLKRRFPAKPGIDINFYALDLMDPNLFHLGASFDSIACLNVLEHIENDGLVLERFRSMLADNGKLILQVPAFQTLYGTIDKIDGHYRRYTRQTLTRKVREAGLKAVSAFYFNAFGVFAWLWHGKILKLKKHPPSELSMWDKAVPLFRRIESFRRPPFGLSVFLIAEKS